MALSQLRAGKLRFCQASLAIGGPEPMLDVVKETMEGKCDRFAYPDRCSPLIIRRFSWDEACKFAFSSSSGDRLFRYYH